MPKPPRIEVEGSILDDLIALGFVDGDGDAVTNNGENIYALGGNDIVDAAGGNDSVWGGLGDDTLYGGFGDDRLYGEDGNDELHGGDGADKLYGGDGNDEMYGDIGNDLMQGGRGNDTVYGGVGEDTINGVRGNNELYGGDGDDHITSGYGTSALDGGANDDTLVMLTKTGADHTATGGAGADTFQFIQTAKAAVSDMTITDFELGIDNFTIEGVADSTYLNLIGAGGVTEVDGDAVLTLTTGDSITFEGISEAVFESFFEL